MSARKASSFLFFILFFTILSYAQPAQPEDFPVGTLREEVPFEPTPIAVVDRMLEMARVTKQDIVYDLGSGDGRIVIMAAKKYGVKSVGIEVNPKLVQLSRVKAREEGVEHLVEFRNENALTADIASASVVTLYMSDLFNAEIKPKLLQLKSGARVVSRNADMDGWPPNKVEKMTTFDKGKKLVRKHTIYLWIVK